MVGKILNRKIAVSLILIVLVAGWIGFSVYRYTNQIVVINIVGPIYDFQKTVSELNDAFYNPNVKAVILYLNTPGGMAYSCIEIAEYVKIVGEVKPLIAVMGSECASGGYYIASFAKKIITYNNTITGSIGVLAVWVDLTKYYEKQGIKVWVWSTSKEKEFGAPWRSPTEEEKAAIQDEVNKIFEKIVGDIKENRNLSSEVLEELKSGKVFYGWEAVKLGLADEVGDMKKALDEASTMAGLTFHIVVSSTMNPKQRFLRAIGLI